MVFVLVVVLDLHVPQNAFVVVLNVGGDMRPLDVLRDAFVVVLGLDAPGKIVVVVLSVVVVLGLDVPRNLLAVVLTAVVVRVVVLPRNILVIGVRLSLEVVMLTMRCNVVLFPVTLVLFMYTLLTFMSIHVVMVVFVVAFVVVELVITDVVVVLVVVVEFVVVVGGPNGDGGTANAADGPTFTGLTCGLQYDCVSDSPVP